MFQDREEAAFRLARRLRGRPLRDPIVLGIPRGGVVVAEVLARHLDADLDVILSCKLRGPGRRELAIGAVAEDGSVYLDPDAAEFLVGHEGYLEEEIGRKQAEIARRKEVLRGNRPPRPLAGRSVIVTDDGIATGSTMLAALKVLARQRPYEIVVAVPVGSPDRLEAVRPLCDELICLHAPADFQAVGPFYEDFHQVKDEEVAALLGREPAAAGR